MPDLKLVAMDAEDLQVLSAHLQDALVLVGEMAYLPRQKRFAAITSRFDWAAALDGTADQASPAAERKRSAIRFERVLAAQLHGIDVKDARKHLQLMALAFEPGEEPGGHVKLVFAGGPQIRLRVECIEAELSDLGEQWAAQAT